MLNDKVWFLFFFFWKWKDYFEKISQALLQYGWIGIFVIALLDSALVPMPSGPDLLLILGISISKSATTLVGYVIAATLGSTIGCIILYSMAKRAGMLALKHVSEERREYVQGLLGRYDALAVVGASLMPPPFPFKPFILTAGVLNFKLHRLIIGLLIGRSLRYSIIGVLTLYFGQTTFELMKKHGPIVLLALAVVAIAVIAIRYAPRLLKKVNPEV